MCRFLLVRSTKPVCPASTVREFARMCEHSRTLDGDRQEDGWGIAWFQGGSWRHWKSLRAIWTEDESFDSFPATHLFAVHARSATFPNQKGSLEFNQPYVHDSLCFVFNGSIQGMRPNGTIPGKIGSQKLFYWIVQRLGQVDEKTSLETLRDWVLGNAGDVVALNIGMIVGTKLLALCQYHDKPEYYTLQYAQEWGITMICSEKIGHFSWNAMSSGEVSSL